MSSPGQVLSRLFFCACLIFAYSGISIVFADDTVFTVSSSSSGGSDDEFDTWVDNSSETWSTDEGIDSGSDDAGDSGSSDDSLDSGSEDTGDSSNSDDSLDSGSDDTGNSGSSDDSVDSGSDDTGNSGSSGDSVDSGSDDTATDNPDDELDTGDGGSVSGTDNTGDDAESSDESGSDNTSDETGTGDDSGSDDGASGSGNTTEEDDSLVDRSGLLSGDIGVSNLTEESGDGTDTSNSTVSTTETDLSGTLGSTLTTLSEETEEESAGSNTVVTLGEVIITGTTINIIPGESGTGYSYNSNGSYSIYESGDYVLTGDINVGSSASFGIMITASDVTLDGNGYSITGSATGETAGIAITADGDNAVVTNFGGISGFYYGIGSYGDNVTISDNTLTDYRYGISTGGGGKNTIVNNTFLMPSSPAFGIVSENGGSIISNNTISGVYYGIYVNGNDFILTNNTVTDSLVGYVLFGNNIILSNNIAADLSYGITASGTNFTIVSNRIYNCSEYGLGIDTDSSGVVYNNYFSNDNNVADGSYNAGTTWTNPDGPTNGTNIIGGPTIAGNYWGNQDGTGWSDELPENETGYNTSNPYEVSSGIYDYAPLVNTPVPTESPTEEPTPTPNPTPSSTPTPTPKPSGGGGDGGSSNDSEDDNYYDDSANDYTSPDDANLSSLLPVNIIITGRSLKREGNLGKTGTLNLTLENTGTTILPPDAKIVLTPVNQLGKERGEIELDCLNGQYGKSLTLDIPTGKGIYRYTFQPEQITIDPDTGEEIRISAGYPVSFIITVHDDGSVEVTTE